MGLEILPLPCEHVHTVINKFHCEKQNQQNFKQIQPYTVLIQGINSIFRDQLPNFHILR